MSVYKRTEVLAGLREAIDFLEAHPDVPIALMSNQISFCVSEVDDAAQRAEVDRIAEALDVEPTGNTHYKAVKQFSGGVSYQATAVTSDEMARWDAVMSYRDAVVPADAVVAEVA